MKNISKTLRKGARLLRESLQRGQPSVLYFITLLFDDIHPFCRRKKKSFYTFARSHRLFNPMDQENLQEGHPQETSSKAKNKTAVFIFILSLLLAIIMFLYYQIQELKQGNNEQLQEILSTHSTIDSIGNELDIRIQTIMELGGEVDTLLALKAQLEADKRQLFSTNKHQRNLISKLNNRVDGYKELLIAKDEEIVQLKMINEHLSEENTVLKVEKNQLNDTLRELKESKKELASKVAFASRLEVTEMKVYGINQKGKERYASAYRNKHIHRLKIQFKVSANEIAPIEGKELLLRVIAPDGNVLFDVTEGSGSFTYENRELFYTANREIIYDRKSQLVTFLYQKGSKYDVGRHTIEVYTDDYLMGQGVFIVK